MKKKQILFLKGAIKGFAFSLILLLFLGLFIKNNVVYDLTEGMQVSFVAKIFLMIYGWPFMIIALVLSFLGFNIFNVWLLFIISSLTYAFIGGKIAMRKHKKNKKHKKFKRK